MRGSTIILALVLACGATMWGLTKRNVSGSLTSSLHAGQSVLAASRTKAPDKLDFDMHVKPILESHCKPCHFAGGALYQRLPFDRPETIKKLGTKLFTRIKDENERQVIREFLSQEQANAK